MSRILVIDDEEQVLDTFEEMFGRAGYEVATAHDGAQALAQLDQCPADLIVVDMLMPGKDGVEVITEVRSRMPDAKIIAISGGGRINAQVPLAFARHLGASVTFEKPVKRSDILEAIAELLEG